jgi:hypothetical protein
MFTWPLPLLPKQAAVPLARQMQVWPYSELEPPAAMAMTAEAFVGPPRMAFTDTRLLLLVSDPSPRAPHYKRRPCARTGAGKKGCLMQFMLCCQAQKRF